MKKLMNFVLKNKSIIVVAVVVVAGGFYFGLRNGSGDELSVSKFETAKVRKNNIEVSVTGSGQIYADGQVSIRPQVAGDGIDVVQVLVKDDQEVKKGDLIAVLDTEEAQKTVRDAELSLRSAEIKLKQTKKASSTQTVDDKWTRQLQEISVNQSRNKLSDAKKDLNDYYIKAPFDGVVTDLNVEAGDSISRDETLASIITNEMYAEISLNEMDAVKVKEGDKAVLTFDVLDGKTFEGTVRKIDTIGTVEQNVVYFKAEIFFDAKESELLRPGMNVGVEIVSDSKQDVLTVPVSAVKGSGESKYVLIVVDSQTETTQEKNVKTGMTDGASIEIVQGLEAGDIVVTKTLAVSSDSSDQSQNSSRGLLESTVRVPGSRMSR